VVGTVSSHMCSPTHSGNQGTTKRSVHATVLPGRDEKTGMEPTSPERRRFPRRTCSLPVELRPPGQPYPTAAETTDVSLCGCYVKLLFPLPIGTVVDIRIGIEDVGVRAKGIVRTTDPALGNGIEFTEIASSCRLQLEHHLETLSQEDSSPDKIIR